MAASNSASKWIGPEPVEGNEFASAQSAIVRHINQDSVELDRFHNHQELSPEGLAKALVELQASMQQLSARVIAVEAEAASAGGAAKGLGLNLLQIGQVLGKRMQTLEATTAGLKEAAAAPAPTPMFEPISAAPRRPLTLLHGRLPRVMLGLGGVLIAVVIAVAVIHPGSPAKPAPPPAQVLYSPGPSDSPNN